MASLENFISLWHTILHRGLIWRGETFKVCFVDFALSSHKNFLDILATEGIYLVNGTFKAYLVIILKNTYIHKKFLLFNPQKF